MFGIIFKLIFALFFLLQKTRLIKIPKHPRKNIIETLYLNIPQLENLDRVCTMDIQIIPINNNLISFVLFFFYIKESLS